MYRILIADDEEVECSVLEMMIKGSGLDCQVLESVYNGIAFLDAVEEQHPDIAIVDINMPGIKGLDAIEMIRRNNQSLKVIINTAYSDFAYIKRAIQYNVFDYVLKPVRRQELYDVLQKLFQQLDDERRMLEKSRAAEYMEERLASLSQSRLMAELLLGTEDTGDFVLYLQSLPAGYAGGVSIAIQGKETAVRAFETEISRSVEYLCKQHDGIWYYLVIPAAEQNAFFAWLRQLTEDLCRKQDAQLRLAVSNWKYDAAGFTEGFRECQTLLLAHGIYGFLNNREKKIAAGKYKQVLMAFPDVHGTIAQRLSEGLRRAKGDAVPFEEFQLCMIIFLVKSLYEEQEIRSPVWWAQAGRWQSWMACHDYRELSDRIEALQGFANVHNGDGHIPTALAAMQKEYFRQDLSLDELADRIGITPFYLSRLFRQELDMNFTEILTDIRMGKALQLLFEENCSAREITVRTGISSLNYFYKVFKKYFGVTIGELRSL